MKKLLAILVVAVMVVSMMPMTMSAATADWVVNSVEGTAVIDGVKDEAYDAFEPLVFETCGEGSGNGGGATLDTPLGYGYIMNDAEFVYFFMDVHDTDLDNTSTNNYERDSVETFFMVAADLDENGNPVTAGTKVQWRTCYDGDMGADTGVAPVAGETCVVKVNDDGSGYVVEGKFPIEEVLNNSIEMLLQINSASGGARSATVYASGHPEGDNGYQRNDRQSDYDCWMTLALAGDHPDTRKDPIPVAQEITAKNYESILNRQFDTQIFVQDQATWSYWNTVYGGPSIKLGETGTFEAAGLYQPVPADALTPELTKDYGTAPKLAVQLSDNAMADGDSEEFTATYSDITIKATGYTDVVIPGETVSKKLKAAAADWGMSGNSWEIDLGTPIISTLGLTVEQFCKEYLPALTDINFTCSFDTYNLNDLAAVQAFGDSLAELEQTYINETLAEYTDRVNAALEVAHKEGATLEELQAALDDATKAANRCSKEVEGSGYTGAAVEHVASLQASVAEIQAAVDAAAATAAPEVVVEEEPTTDAPADDTASTSSEGGNTGLIVGIVVAVVVVIAAVVGIVLGKKKKN